MLKADQKTFRVSPRRGFALCIIWLMADVSGAAAQPHGPAAETRVNTFARISVDLVSCGKRPKAWGDKLRLRLREVVSKDRPDLLAEMDHTLSFMSRSSPRICEDKPEEVDQELKTGDSVINGGNIWSLSLSPE